MASADSNSRVSSLLENAEKAIQEDNIAKAAVILKEASGLQPDNPDVQKKWLALQSQTDPGDSTKLVLQYITSGDNREGDRVLRSLRASQIKENDAVLILNALETARKDLAQLDAIISTLLLRQLEARKQLANHFANNITNLFSQYWNTGEETFRIFASLPADETLWKTQDKQVNAQRELFQQCIAKIIEAGAEHVDWAMRVVARSLATSSANLIPIVDEDVFDAVLSSLDIRLDTALRSQATVAAAKMLECTNEKGEELFAKFVQSRVAKQTSDDLVVAFSAAATAFPMIPATATKLFMTDGFVQQLVPNLERNSQVGASAKRKSRTLEESALELLSAACVDKSCREAIKRYCAPWLQNLAEERNGINQALSALILAKISASSEVEITEKLSELVLSGENDPTQAIEGLAYTSLQPRIKEQIAQNGDLITNLVKDLENKPSVAFGCLTVFLNLTVYRPAKSEEQKKMAQLKAYANQSKPEPVDPLDNNSFVTQRCKVLLEHDVVSALVANCKQSSSPTIISLTVRILLSLSREQKHRSKMAQQGAAKLLLQIRERVTKTDKATQDAAVIERNASHALARLLISLNPAHIFTSAIPATSAVSALVLLLSYDQDGEERDLLPTFEALLALTNLASMEEKDVHDLILRSAWEKIEDLLFSSNVMVQRAAMELVCNLMAAPECVAKFADGSVDAKRRITILLALADVEDLATRRAAGGGLAMLTEWDAAVSALLDAKNDRGMDVVLAMCQDDSEEIQHRGFVCLANVLNAPKDVGSRGSAVAKKLNASERLGTVLSTTRNQQIMALGIQVLSKVSN